jgi:hypothetical protein
MLTARGDGASAQFRRTGCGVSRQWGRFDVVGLRVVEGRTAVLADTHSPFQFRQNIRCLMNGIFCDRSHRPKLLLALFRLYCLKPSRGYRPRAHAGVTDRFARYPAFGSKRALNEAKWAYVLRRER